MSTRGFVGIGTADQWDARYNHYDSYPTGLGCDVWATARQFLIRDGHLHSFAQELLRYTDWRQMATKGICEYCGRRTGHPHSISGLIYDLDPAALPPTKAVLRRQKLAIARRYHWSPERQAMIPDEVDKEWRVIENLKTTGYPDPDARYHDHDPDDPALSAITPSNVDWIFMEWGYIIDPDRQCLHVFVGGINTPVTYTVEIIRPNGTREFWANCKRVTGALVGTYDLAGSEPDWKAVEAAGRALHDHLEAVFATHPDHPLLAPIRQRPAVEVWNQWSAS